MALGSSLGNLETFIKEIINRMKEMVMAKCILQMEPYIKESGLEEFKEVKVR